MTGKKEYGDYQTPLNFANAVCEFLFREKGIRPSVVIEPTCGVGNFLISSLIFDAKRYYGVEINPVYCSICRNRIKDERACVRNEDFFSSDILELNDDHILVIGNPPWVTSSDLTLLGSDNIPPKKNFKGLNGLDAITGSGNFDICEYIIEKILFSYQDRDATLALLCKISVARNVFEEVQKHNIGCEYFEIFEFDAKKIFSVNSAACLLLIKISPKHSAPRKCDVYRFDNPGKKLTSFGFHNNALCSDLDHMGEDFGGESCFVWRQGVKHDCSKVMELKIDAGKYINGFGERLDLESTYIYPLIKSSMFKNAVIQSSEKSVIVTQKKAGEDTSGISVKSPKLWSYLTSKKPYFDKRKSSIYANAPDFSMFGVGDYSYSNYKVGISGFCKTPFFSLLDGCSSKSIMTDDTSYFISFDSYELAYAAMLYLNTDRVLLFLKKISFVDSKRPFTKKVLSHIDFAKIVRTITFKELESTEKRLGLRKFLTSEMCDHFSNLVHRATAGSLL